MNLRALQPTYKTIGNLTEPASSEIATSDAAVSPLSDYRSIWDRDLFATPGKTDNNLEQQISLSTASSGPEALGLKLVGTMVVAQNPDLSVAVINDIKDNRQGTFHEGDATEGMRIKKILRNRVIVGTADGELWLDVESSLPSSAAPVTKKPLLFQPADNNGKMFTQKDEANGHGVDFRLHREAVATGLSENDYFMRQVRTYPYTEGALPKGFRISYIRAGSVLAEMGLRNGDVVQGINRSAFTSPEQSDKFFRRLTEGGNVTIKLVRRGNPLRINIDIL